MHYFYFTVVFPKCILLLNKYIICLKSLHAMFVKALGMPNLLYTLNCIVYLLGDSSESKNFRLCFINGS